MLQDSSECLLRLLQKLAGRHSQVKQIQSFLITKGHLQENENSKRKTTLFYNTLIGAHLHFGNSHASLRLFTLLLANQTPPNSHTFPSAVRAAASSSPSAGLALHNQVIKRGFRYDAFIQTSLIAFYSQLGDLDLARRVFDEIARPSIVENNAMLDACGKNGDMESAALFFKAMPQRDAVTWASFINGYSSNGLFGKAIEAFRTMIAHLHDNSSHRFCLVRPILNEAVYVSVISSCANLDASGVVHLGRQMHCHVTKALSAVTVFIGTALIDFYGKVGCVDAAMKVFESMAKKQVCTWNALISSLGNNGKEMEALGMFHELRKENVRPNAVTFVAVLAACARKKLITTGLQVFRSMRSEWGVVPKMEHYGCVVDLLGKAGLLREAEEFMNSMPFEPDASVLGALLGACKTHRAIDLGNEVGRRLIHLQPWHSGRHVVLSSLNAEMKRWDVAASVRETMLEVGTRKLPAFSFVDSSCA